MEYKCRYTPLAFSIVSLLTSAAVSQQAPPSSEPRTRDAKEMPDFAVEARLVAAVDVDKNLARIRARTNLPSGTVLMVTVEQRPAGFRGSTKATVDGDGKVEAGPFGPDGGLGDGNYVATAVTVYAALQPESVREAFGPRGERLKGRQVRTEATGKTVEASVSFTIGSKTAAHTKAVEEVAAARDALRLVSQVFDRARASEIKTLTETKRAELLRGLRNQLTEAKGLLKASTPGTVGFSVAVAAGDVDVMLTDVAFGRTDHAHQAVVADSIGSAQRKLDEVEKALTDGDPVDSRVSVGGSSIGQFSLSSIYMVNNVPGARFLDSDTGKYRAVSVGDKLDQWRVEKIDYEGKRVFLKNDKSGEVVGLGSQGDDDRNHSAATSSASDRSGIPADVTYAIIESSVLTHVKRSINVRLNKAVCEEVLRAIALKLKAQDPQPYERTFIYYYLPEMLVGHGAWATTHFNPDLEVDILGLSAQDEAKLLAERPAKTHEVIGRWLDESPSVASRVTIYREEGNVFVEWAFADGKIVKELKEKTLPGGDRRFDPLSGEGLLGAGGAASGEHLIIGTDGHLQIRDKSGLIAIARKVD